MRALHFTEFGPVSNLRLIELPAPKADATTAIVKIAAASITPSDVKNVEGSMEHTTLPRVPGRDYAGTVVEGPAEWLGTEVWGTGGEIGYSINGSHAELIAVPVASLRRKPSTLSLEQAAAVGLTYLAAWLGLIEHGRLAAGEHCWSSVLMAALAAPRRRSESGAALASSAWTGACRCPKRPRPLLLTISLFSTINP